MIFKNVSRTSKKTHGISVTRISHLKAGNQKTGHKGATCDLNVTIIALMVRDIHNENCPYKGCKR